MIQGVLFDFDGTLADTLGCYREAYAHALQKYKINLSEEEIVKQCFGKKEAVICEHFHILSVQEFTNYYFEGVRSFKDVQLFPGVMEVLNYTKEKKLKTGIVTFAYRWYIDMMLDRLEIRDFFQIVISADDVKNPKPAPEAVFKASEILEIPVREVLNIGDAKSDILMGKSAGDTAVLFFPEKHKEFYTLADLEEAHPDHIITNFIQLKEYL